MADQKISALTELTTILAQDVLPIVDGTTTYKVQGKNLIASNIITGVLITGMAQLQKAVFGDGTCAATGTNANCLGGVTNSVNSLRSVIVQGQNNTVSDGSNVSFIGNGLTNLIGALGNSAYNFIGNGSSLQTYGASSTCLNGSSSIATGNYSLNLNGSNLLNYGTYNTIVNSSNTTILGTYNCVVLGDSNGITGDYGIVFGNNNYISKNAGYGVIGGQNNSVTGNKGVVLNGNNSIAGGLRSFIANGATQVISHNLTDGASILAGTNNTIAGLSSYSVILCGSTNTISKGNSSSILQGDNSLLSGNYQTAIGSSIQIPNSHVGAIVLADSTSVPKYSFSPDSLVLNFQSGVYISGGLLSLQTNYRLPAASLSVGYVPGTILVSGHNLIIATGINASNQAMFGKIALTTY